MSRIKLLQLHEIKEFDLPSNFDFTMQSHYFSVDTDLAKELKKLKHSYSKIGMILQWGYFKYHGRFFEVANFRAEDINFIIKQLQLTKKKNEFFRYYNNHLAYEHRTKILSITQWHAFDESAFKHQVERLVELQMLPRKILWETKAYLFRQKMEAPAYDKYLRIINGSMLLMTKRINQSLEKCLSVQHRRVLDEFLFRKAPYQPADIIQYKTINQSNQPRKIKRNIELFKILKDRLDRLKDPIQEMRLSDAIIDYHANWTHISDNDKLAIHSDKYLFLLCFLIRQVRLRHDFFIDLILECVKASENQTIRLQQENYFLGQKQRIKATKLLIESRFSYLEQIQKIKDILNTTSNDSHKVTEIEQVLRNEQQLSQEQEKLVAGIEAEINRDEKAEYYNLLETKSKWLSNRIGQVINHLVINAENTNIALLEAINHYISRNGDINVPPKNMDWLDNKQQDFIWQVNTDTGEIVFQRKIYKMLLFQAIRDGIKSGTICFNCSYRYLFLEEYLIDKQVWNKNKEQLLKDAELQHAANSTAYLKYSQEYLDDLYRQTNENLEKNKYFKFNRSSKPVILTPAVEKPDLGRVSMYFKPAGLISISKILSDIEKSTSFLQHFGHQSKVHEKKRPSSETFFAAIIAMGCNIGVDKMGNISKGIQTSDFKKIIEWYFGKSALEDSSDAIIKVKNELSLPEIHRKDPEELHTASDGQKFLIKGDSFNASYSYKYPGFNKAVVANTAIDERFAIFYSTVVMASDREAVNVIDMHLGNPIIKSTIHSTDTHGSTEVVFGMLQLLGIYFAPRIKDIGSLELYSFVSKKQYADLGYKLLPDHYINTSYIKEHWDDILRIMVSLKLGKTTAFQLLKKLNSYAKKSPLQKALKEFGKISRTAFILKYYDDIELRQSVEKSLSHIELMNRFAKAVFIGNNQEFTVATKDEQEKVLLCRRLIQNAIVLWNYLYLSELVLKIKSQEELEEMIDVIRNGTAITWQHINMLGEYDFSKLVSDKTLRFDMQKLKSWKYTNS